MENLSRTELEKKIGGLEAQIDDLRNATANGNEINLGEIEKLQSELDLLNEELSEMERNDGGIAPKTEDEINEITNNDEKEELEKARKQEEQEKNEKEKMEKEHEQQENDEQKDQEKKEKEEKELPKDKDEEVAPQNDGERRLTLLDWQKESGVELLPDDAIKKKYDKFLTREEFMEVLDKENVPKIIREPGRAESFLKSDEDWRAVETSDSSLREAIEAGNIPTNVDNDDYIKRQYGDGRADVRDNDENPNQDGYGKIDKDDVNEAVGHEDDEKEVEDEKAVNAKENNEEKEEEKENVSAELGAAMIDEVIGDVSKSEVDKVSGTLSYMMRNPLKELENEINFTTLEARKSNAPVINMYQKMGFENAGIRPRFYTAPDEDAVIMTKNIKPGE